MPFEYARCHAGAAGSSAKNRYRLLAIHLFVSGSDIRGGDMSRTFDMSVIPLALRPDIKDQRFFSLLQFSFKFLD